MRSAFSCDVAVVGAGLAGLWSARALARRALRVALIEAEPTVDARVRTTGIFVRRTFEDFAFPAGTLGIPIRRVVLYSPKRRALALESSRDEFRIADMRSLSRALLRDCIERGVVWLPATRYRGVCAQGCCVALENKSRRFDLAARFIIGADGGRSGVAADLGLSRNTRFIIAAEDVYEAGSLAPPTLHCFLEPNNAPGYIAWVALDGAQAHVGVGGDPASFQPRSALRRFTCSLDPVIDLSGLRIVERRAGLIPVNGVLGSIANPRGLLVGDAAGAVSPLTAGGLDACVRLSEFAAYVAARALNGEVNALEAYRGGTFEGRFATRRWMRSALRNAPPLALETICAAFRLPLLKSVASRFFFGDGSFPDVDHGRINSTAKVRMIGDYSGAATLNTTH